MCKRWYNPVEKNNAFLHLKLSSHLSFYCSYLSFVVADFFFALVWFVGIFYLRLRYWCNRCHKNKERAAGCMQTTSKHR